MKKRVFIIHGWEGRPDKEWMPWLKRELEKNGFETIVPQMPNPMSPEFNPWIGYLHQVVKNPDQDTFLVGHSLGCIAILRYLESLNKKVGGTVLVAGFGEDLEYEGYKGELSSFFKVPIDWNKIKRNSKKFITFHSKDDPWVNIKNSELFKEKLDAESVVVDGMGHFNVLELPLALEAVLKVYNL